MSYSDVRTGIKTLMESITVVGKVNDYVVWSDDWDTLLAKFVVDGRVNTWQIGLLSFPPYELDASLVTKVFNIGLFGLYSIKTDQESSKTFEDICETIADNFTTSLNPISLKGASLTSPPALTSFDNTVYLDTPAHRATLQLQYTVTEERRLGCKE